MKAKNRAPLRHEKAVRDAVSGAVHRVLVLSASAGAGHVRAAQALERALIATRRVGEIRHVDILQYTTKLFRRLYAQAYLMTSAVSPDRQQPVA